MDMKYLTVLLTFSFVNKLNMTYHRFCNKSSTTGTTIGAGTAYSSDAPKFTSGVL